MIKWWVTISWCDFVPIFYFSLLLSQLAEVSIGIFFIDSLLLRYLVVLVRCYFLFCLLFYPVTFPSKFICIMVFITFSNLSFSAPTALFLFIFVFLSDWHRNHTLKLISVGASIFTYLALIFLDLHRVIFQRIEEQKLLFRVLEV